MSGIIAAHDEDEVPEEIEEEEEMTLTPPPPPPAPPTPEGSITIPVPLAQNKVATVTLPMHMSKTDWERLDRILTAYRPDDAIVEQNEPIDDDLDGADGEPE